MRIVVATTTEDPFALVFWEAYRVAGGAPPAAVFFIAPRQGLQSRGRLLDALLLFGPITSARTWWRGRQVQQMLGVRPGEVFAGTEHFHHVATLNRGPGLAALQEEHPDILVSVGSPEIFRPPVLQTPRLAALNVHNGRLPAYRGLFGTFWEASRSETWGYVSIHVMVPQVDAGPVVAQVPVACEGRALFDVLLAKKRVGGRLLASLLTRVARAGSLPAPRPAEAVPSRHHPWPSLRDVLALRLRWFRGHGKVRDTARLTPLYWPPELSVSRDDEPSARPAAPAAGWPS